MEFQDEGIIIALRKYGEFDAVINVMTKDHGRHGGLVKGGMGRRQRGVLQPGNEVLVRWRGRLESQLGTYGVELSNARSASFLDYPARLGVLNSVCAVLMVVLAERESHPEIYAGLRELLDILEQGQAAPDGWGALLIRWEIGLLSALGFGLDLSRCAATGGQDDLIYVSPRSGRAVSAAAGRPYHDKMLLLPPFLRPAGATAPVSTQDMRDGLRLTAFFLERHVLLPHHKKIPQARRMLADFLG